MVAWRMVGKSKFFHVVRLSTAARSINDAELASRLVGTGTLNLVLCPDASNSLTSIQYSPSMGLAGTSAVVPSCSAISVILPLTERPLHLPSQEHGQR